MESRGSGNPVPSPPARADSGHLWALAGLSFLAVRGGGGHNTATLDVV